MTLPSLSLAERRVRTSAAPVISAAIEKPSISVVGLGYVGAVSMA